MSRQGWACPWSGCQVNHIKKGNPTRLRRPLQRLSPLELGARSQGDSTADIPDVPTGTEQAEVRPRQGAACIAGIADIPDMLDAAQTRSSTQS